jgi:hypothetical protein
MNEMLKQAGHQPMLDSYVLTSEHESAVAALAASATDEE